MGAPRERLVTPWSDWAAPGSAQELLGVLGAPRSAWQRLPRAFVLRRSRVPGAPGDAWQQEHRLGCAWAAPAPRLGDTWEALRKAWGALGAPLGPHARAGIHGAVFLMAFARIGKGPLCAAKHFLQGIRAACSANSIFCKGFGPRGHETVFFTRDRGGRHKGRHKGRHNG